MIANVSRLGRVVSVFAAVAFATPVWAQQIPGGPGAQAQSQVQPKSKSQSPPAAKAAPKESAAAQGGGDGQLRQRVEQLEEQLVDMQVVVGTLESLARSGGGGAAAAAAGRSGGAALSSAEAGRLDGLETQIRALTAQLEQLAEQVRAMQSGQGQRQGSLAPAPLAPAPAGRAAPAPAAETVPRFGSQTVTPTPQSSDPIGGLLGDSGREPAPGRPAQAAAGASDGGPKQLYETAYGYLLQQDYGAAEAAFTDFLQRYPSDPLAGNAQYWLGESFYVRGNYKAAAGSFLKGYQTYARSAKAPESLLKLAMSLDRLGQRDAACTSYGELAQKFPNAPAHVKNRAVSERARIGCA